MKSLIAIILLGVMPIVATAQDAQWKTAMNNLSHEYAQCAAYFLVVSVAMENSDEPQTAAEYEAISNSALEYASIYGQEAGLLAETSKARFEMEFTEMAGRIGHNTSNIAILGAEFANPCKAAMEDTSARLHYWVERTMNGRE